MKLDRFLTGWWMLALVALSAFLLNVALIPFFQGAYSPDSYVHALYARGIWDYGSLAIDTKSYDTYSCASFPCQVDQRPPLFDAMAAAFGGAFGGDFLYAGKFVNAIFSALVSVPVFLLARRFLRERLALLVAVFIVFSPYVISYALDSEVRIVTAFFALMSLHFFLDRRYSYSAAFLSLTFLSHYIEAYILMFVLLAYLIARRRGDMTLKRLAIPAVVFLLIASPWLVRNELLFGSPIYNSASQYFSYTSNFQQFFLDKPHNSLQDLVYTRLYTLGRTIVPVPFSGGSLDLNWAENHNLFARSIVSLASIPLFVLAFLGFARRRGRDLALAYMACGIAIAVLLTGFPSAPDTTTLTPQIILLMVAGMVVALQSKRMKILLVVVALGLAAQIPMVLEKLSPTQDFGQGLIESHVAPGDVVMTRWTQTHIVAYVTGRRTVAMPYGNATQLLGFARENNATWALLDGFDMTYDGGREAAILLSANTQYYYEEGGFKLVRLS